MAKRPDSFETRLVDHWYTGKKTLGALEGSGLWLIMVAYRVVLALRAAWFNLVAPPARIPGVRTIAIGNLVAGGAGKTPCTLALALALTRAGRRCAIVTRGYRSDAERAACRIALRSDLPSCTAQTIGDEAWLLAWHTGLPVASGNDRRRCVETLRSRFPELDTVILDDGLQQHDLACDTTVLLVDGRGFGNGQCLPYGPLREPIGDLTRFTGLVRHGVAHDAALPGPLPRLQSDLTYDEGHWVNLEDWRRALESGNPLIPRAPTDTQQCLAVAGIAVPERFFDQCASMGFSIEPLALRDHDPQTVNKTQTAWQAGRYTAILMTEKDAVKFLHHDAPLLSHAWALVRRPRLSTLFLSELCHGSKTS